MSQNLLELYIFVPMRFDISNIYRVFAIRFHQIHVVFYDHMTVVAHNRMLHNIMKFRQIKIPLMSHFCRINCIIDNKR